MKLTKNNKIAVWIISIFLLFIVVDRLVLNKDTPAFGNGLIFISSSRIQNITDSLPKHPHQRYSERPTDRLKYIIWHHSATSTGTPEAFARYHIERRGWAGIGYTFVIQQDGTIYQTNELNSRSWHCTGRNTDGIGICLVGSFDNVRPTQAQINSSKWLAKYLRRFLNIDLISKGHTDFANKSCPGNTIAKEVHNW